MNKLISRSFITVSTLMAVLLVTIFLIAASPARAAQSTVDLGAAAPFAILAGTPNITNTGPSVITGDVGLAPAAGAGIGLTCGQVIGTIYSVDATGPLPCRVTNGPLLVTAKNNLTAAYTDAAGRTPVTTIPTELGGSTLVAGVYDSASTTFGLTGTLTLDGQNDPSSVFIFQVPASGVGLTVGAASTVVLTNGAQACNVFWRVDSASINTTANFTGTILALTSISVANGATIQGRLLAQNGSVTLINDTITAPICAGNDSTDNTEDNVIPGFPNTGDSRADNILWIALPSFIIIIGVIVALVARKKHLI